MKNIVCRFTVLSAMSLLAAMQASCMKEPAASEASAAATPETQPTAAATQPIQAAKVRIDNFKFEPRELTISVGTAVTWVNGDDVPHTATSKDDPQSFDSGTLDTDDKFAFTFSKPGTYTYYCKVHPHMTGVVIVK